MIPSWNWKEVLLIGSDMMNYYLVGTIVLLIILMTIQYSLNKIILLLKEIKHLLKNLYNKDNT